MIGTGGQGLGATLSVPCAGVAFAGAVLVAGSGPQDRDESTGTFRPLGALAEALSSNGVVTLRYDKRTFARAAGLDLSRLTVDGEFIDDALAALRALRLNPATKGLPLFLIGHSMGALVAPQVAERDAEVAAIILIAPPGRPLPLLIASQVRALGSSDASAVEDRARRLLAGELPPDALFLGLPVAYWLDLEQRRELERAARLDRPILVLRGSEDLQVAQEDQDLWQHALAGARGSSVESVPGMDHLMTNANKGLRFDPMVGARILRFMRDSSGSRAVPFSGAPR